MHMKAFIHIKYFKYTPTNTHKKTQKGTTRVEEIVL